VNRILSLSDAFFMMARPLTEVTSRAIARRFVAASNTFRCQIGAELAFSLCGSKRSNYSTPRTVAGVFPTRLARFCNSTMCVKYECKLRWRYASKIAANNDDPIAGFPPFIINGINASLNRSSAC
jgi:hypothetical protein